MREAPPGVWNPFIGVNLNEGVNIENGNQKEPRQEARTKIAAMSYAYGWPQSLFTTLYAAPFGSRTPLRLNVTSGVCVHGNVLVLSARLSVSLASALMRAPWQHYYGTRART